VVQMVQTRNLHKNLLSVDVEEWYHANYDDVPANYGRNQSRVLIETETLLGLLAQTNTSSTFFILGEVAEAHPRLVQTIAKAGHEIASHSYCHDLVFQMTCEQFRDQARRSKAVLEDTSGQRVRGFRAPSWSVDSKRTPWFWRELKGAGYTYSSSLFPLKNFLYGEEGAPRFKHERDGLIEIPPSTAQILGKRIPFSGGFYLRALPWVLIKLATLFVNHEQQPVVFYVHPREIDRDQPRLPISRRNAFIHYIGISGTKRKLMHITGQKNCTSFVKMFPEVAEES
jgi:polysaccharide deacetylase family protein (PEP-CTERM system associated)